MMSMDADLKVLVDEMNDIFIGGLMNVINEDISQTSPSKHINENNQNHQNDSVTTHSSTLLNSYGVDDYASILDELNGLLSPNMLFKEINSFITNLQQLSRFVLTVTTLTSISH